MIVENPQKSMKKILELINEFSSVTGYKTKKMNCISIH
jgi:hypothetical protein